MSETERAQAPATAPGRQGMPLGARMVHQAQRQTAGRWPTIATAAAAAGTAAWLVHTVTPWTGWLAFAVLAAIALWWSAPRARPPALPEQVLFAAAATGLGLVAAPAGAWPLPMVGLAWGLGLLPPAAGNRWAAATATAVLAAGWLSQPERLMATPLALALGIAAGCARRAGQAHRDDAAALLTARDAARTEAAHLRYLLEVAATAPAPAPRQPWRGPRSGGPPAAGSDSGAGPEVAKP